MVIYYADAWRFEIPFLLFSVLGERYTQAKLRRGNHSLDMAAPQP